MVHTEITCPDRVILLKYSSKEEVKKAIRSAVVTKRGLDTGESYTPLKFSKNRSIQIDKMSPEDMMKCSLNEIPATKEEQENAHKYFR